MECTCTPAMLARHLRISSRLLDRIDIHITVPRVEIDQLAGNRRGESLAAIRRGWRERGKFSTSDSCARTTPRVGARSPRPHR
jgi:hypothetical protein